MFKISTKGDYGLLLLSALARSWGKSEFLSLKEIAEKEKLPLAYLSQIISELKGAGLVTSKEGRDGGYQLSRAPGEITLIKALEILEGPISPVKCCKSEEEKKSSKGCACEATCTVKPVWKEAQEHLTKYLEKKTLADTI